MFNFVVVEARNGIFEAIVLATLNILCAQFVFLTYGLTISEKSEAHIPSEISSICVAVIQLLANIVTLVLVDRTGRRLLLTLSMLGCALSHAVMATYLYLDSSGIDFPMFHLIPLVGMTSLIFASAIGIVPLLVICVAETFPAKTRSFGMTLSTTVLNILSFMMNKIFPIAQQSIGLMSCLVIFCVACTFGVFYSIFILKETKGKELNLTVKLKQPV